MRWHWQASCVVCAVVVVLLFVSLSAGDMSLDEEKDQGSLIFFASLLKPTQHKIILGTTFPPTSWRFVHRAMEPPGS